MPVLAPLRSKAKRLVQLSQASLFIYPKSKLGLASIIKAPSVCKQRHHAHNGQKEVEKLKASKEKED